MAKKAKDAQQDSSDLELWKKRIRASEKLRDRARDEQGWNRFIDYMKGKYALDKVPGFPGAVPTINLVFGYIRDMVASLYFRNPYTVVNPRNAQSIAAARLLELDLNHRKEKMKVKPEIKKTLKDTGLIGHGWVMVGYCADVGEVPAEKGEIDKDAEVTGLKQVVKKEEIFCVHVPWDDVVFDIASKDPPYDCRWIGYSFTKPLDEVKDSPAYKNTAKLTSNVSLREMKQAKDKMGSGPEQDYDLPLVKLFVVFDLVKREVKVLSLNHDKFLREDPYEYPFDCPLSMLAFNRVNGEPYPLSDIYLTEPQILGQIKLHAQMLNHIKRHNRQISIEAGTMKPAEKEKLVQGIDGAVTERTKGSNPPTPIQYAAMQNEIFAVDRIIKDDRDSILGRSALARGEKDDSQSKTLGEAKLKLMGSQTSTEDRLDVLEDFIEEVDAKILALIQKYQDVPTSVPMPKMPPEAVAGAFNTPPQAYDGQSLTFDKNNVQGDVEPDVKAGSSVKVDKQARDQFMMQFLEVGLKEKMLMPNGPVAHAIMRDWLRDMELKSAEKALEDEVEFVKQMQQRQVGMQDQVHQVEVAKKAAETEKQKARAQADLSKAETGKHLAAVEEKKVQVDAIHKAAELSALHSPGT